MSTNCEKILEMIKCKDLELTDLGVRMAAAMGNEFLEFLGKRYISTSSGYEVTLAMQEYKSFNVYIKNDICYIIWGSIFMIRKMSSSSISSYINASHTVEYL